VPAAAKARERREAGQAAGNLGTTAKELSEQWQAMGEEEKEQYNRQSTQQR